MINVKQGAISVLVVEDDYLVALETREILESAGYAVPAVVPSGSKALAVTAEQKPSVALVDISLVGDMNGIETAVELAALGVPTIFATGHSNREILAKGEAARPVAWLFKPFSEQDLLRAIAKAIGPTRR